VAAWTAIDQELGPAVITPGVRAFYNGQKKRSSADPRLRGRVALGDSNTLKGAVGQYSQSPEPAEGSPEFGNPKLDFERSMHYVTGLETRWGDDWTTELQLFAKEASSIVTNDNALKYANKGAFRSKGFETFIRRNATGRAFGWLSYTYSKTEERTSPDQDYRASRYDQTHVVNLAASYKLSVLWELGSRYNHHTGDTYTPVTDSVYNAMLDKYTQRGASADAYSKRLPAYNSLTLYLTRQYLFDTWKMALKFGLESYWPKAQVLGKTYNYDFSKERNQTGLSSIPFLELRGEL